MTTVSVLAPAKVNLCLHVTGRREDGYHEIDSLVAFAEVGDRLSVRPDSALSLALEGPEASGVPGGMDNLALRAASLAAEGQGAAIRLRKLLPAASGIGGGSSDAAATYRAISMLRRNAEAPFVHDRALPERQTRDLLAIGADVPMCLVPRPWRARGIGDRLEPVDLPPLPAVLANPRVAVPTAEVFRALDEARNAPLPERLPAFAGVAATVDFLASCRNDLQPPAIELAPVIAEVLAALEDLPGCRLARMSGSGATCFGLFEEEGAARAALGTLRESRPEWWIAGGLLGDMSGRAAPVAC